MGDWTTTNLSSFSGPLLAVSQALFLLALSLRPSPYRWIFFFPISGIILYLTFFTTTGNPVLDYGIACTTITNFFAASDYILLTEVQRELRLKGQQEVIFNAPLLTRLKWAAMLVTSPRGVGWTHEPKYITRYRPKGTTRTGFIISQALWIAAYLFAFSLADINARYNTSLAKGGPSLTAYGWLWRAFNVLTWGIQAMVSINIQHLWVGIIAVATGLSVPEEWPHLFGHIGDAYTVRRFWGRVWHQLLRRLTGAHAGFISSRILGFNRGGKAASVVHLYTAFLISAIIHYLPDYVMIRHWGGGSIQFFLLQAVVITLEDVVFDLAAKAGYRSSKSWKWLGYLWVCAWFTYSVPMWLDPLIHAGLMEGGLHYNLILGVWQGEWEHIPRA